MSAADSRPVPPHNHRPPARFRPSRAEILACLSLVVALLSLLWSSDRFSPRSPADNPSEQSVRQRGRPSPASASTIASGIPLDDFSNASAQLSARARRSVVRVESSRKGRTPPADDLETYFGTLPPETVGSGFVVDTQGHILTNYHVVRGADALTIRSSDDESFEAVVVGYDPLTDLALLKTSALNLPLLNWGDSEKLLTGHLVWAIGSPYGLDQSVSMGIISSVDRTTLLDSPFQDFLQSDATINPGNSGGPLLDSHGEVVGITTATYGQNFSGINFALPSHAARRVLAQLLEHGEVPRGWIGVQLGTVTPARAAVAGMEQSEGAYIESLASVPASPAQEAGLRVADICTRFDGQPVTGPLGLIRQIASRTIGTTVKLTIVRKGQLLDLTVTVQRRP